MARILKNKYPIDSDDRKIIGFSFPLNGDAVFNPTYLTKDQIKANLINFMLTNKGERLFNPNFGADLRNVLFNTIDLQDQNDLKDRIEDQITEEFPEITITTLSFNNQIDSNTINMLMEYEINRFGIEDKLQISIN